MTSCCATMIRAHARTSWATHVRLSSGTGRKWSPSSPASASCCWLRRHFCCWRRPASSAASVARARKSTRTKRPTRRNQISRHSSSSTTPFHELIFRLYRPTDWECLIDSSISPNTNLEENKIWMTTSVTDKWLQEKLIALGKITWSLTPLSNIS